MAAGAFAMATTDTWEIFLAGHLLAGLGGVLVNILMTKMVADWFAGAEITTALAIFINSWPLGIALGLVVFPPLALAFGVGSAFWLLTVLALTVGALVALFYRRPGDLRTAGGPRLWPRGEAMKAVLQAGVCWGAFNGGLAILFGLGTTLLVERGGTPEAAARATSLILWVLAVAAPMGGFIADRTGRGATMIVIGLIGLAVLSPLALLDDLTVPVFLAYGAVSGLVAGPIMSLPARALDPEMRIVGMGLFFTVYYAFIIAAPALAGSAAEFSGAVGTAFWCAAFLQLWALAGLVFHQRALGRLQAVKRAVAA
jgi:MFS family permease